MEDMKSYEGSSSSSAVSSPMFPDSPANNHLNSFPNSPANTQRRSRFDDLKMSTSFKTIQEQESPRDILNMNTNSVESSDDDTKDVNPKKVHIDTAAPFESVRAAVSKFGGLLDRKAKAAAAAAAAEAQSEPENIEDMIMYKQQLEVAEDAKAQVLDELDRTNRLIQELKHSLEKIETEEAQAKQDSELAHLRVREMEQGISDNESPAAKAQIEVFKARHDAAVKELESVTKDLAMLELDYQRLVTERDSAVARADEAVSVFKENQRKVEELTNELVATKDALEAAHAAHFTAEEARMCTAWAKDQDTANCENELKKAEQEMQHLTEELAVVNDLMTEYETRSALLTSLKSELALYNEDSETRVPGKKELQEIRASIEKAKDDVNCLRDTSSSFKSELDRETEALAALRERKDKTVTTVCSLEAELNRIKSELESVQLKEKEAKEKSEELPNAIQLATLKSTQAKSVANTAREELEKAKQEAERANAEVSAVKTRLFAAQKEIKAAKAAEHLALGTTRAMQESEEKQTTDSTATITLATEEYYSLSKSAQEAEEQANMKVISAIEQIKDAKKSELCSLERLDAVQKALEEKKAGLSAAVAKAECASEEKEAAEQELRDWRAQNETSRRTTSEAFVDSPTSSGSEREETKGCKHASTKSEPVINFCGSDMTEKGRRKKSFFPRVVMFLARKKVQTVK